MANIIHCDICDDKIKGHTLLDLMHTFFRWYEFKEGFLMMPTILGQRLGKMTVCENCFQDFKEFVLRKRSCFNSLSNHKERGNG